MPNIGNYILDIQITTAGAEPIDRDEDVKPHLGISFTDDNNILDSLMIASRTAVESYAGVSLMTHTIKLTVDLCEQIELPHGPVAAISSVKVKTGVNSADGTAIYETLSGNDYSIDGQDFVFLTSSREGRHLIEYTTRQVSEASALLLAVLNEIAYRYEHRGDEGKQYAAESPGVCEAARALADPYRRMTWR